MTLIRRSSVVVAGTVSLTVILAMSLPVAAPGPGQRTQSVVHHGKAETLKLTLKDAVETEVDVNKDGTGAGDYAAAGTLAIAGPAAAQGHQAEHASHGTTVLVHGDGTNVTLSRSSVNEGRISFKVNSSNSTPGAGSQITLFRLVGHATLDTFKADLGDEFTPDPMVAAKGTRELNRDIRAFGLADVSPGNPAMVTERLTAGRYYLMDLGNNQGVPDPTFTTFTVRHSGRGLSDRQGDSLHSPVVKLTSADRFVGPGNLPARGTVTVMNVADTIHFMSISPVQPGTTDAQIQAVFEGDPAAGNPFIDGPSVGMDVLSPGRQLQLTYNLPPGTYVLLCFIADDVTGMPHADMGMHKVVTLK